MKRIRGGATLVLVASSAFWACGGSTDDGGGGAGAPTAGSTALPGGAGGGAPHAGAPSGGAAGAMPHGGAGAGGSGASNLAGSSGANAGSGGKPGSGGNGGTGGKAGSGGTAGSGGGNSCDSATTCCPTAQCGCPYPAGNGTSNVISDLEDGKLTFKTANTAANGFWDFSKDASTGTIVPSGTAALSPVAGGANGTASALHVSGNNLTGWGAALTALLGNGCPFDASKYGGISFYAKGTSSVAEGSNQLLLLVGNPDYLPSSVGGFCNEGANDPRCYARHRVPITLTATWKQYIVAWEDLQLAPYGNPLPFGPNRVRDIIFSANGPSPSKTPAASFDFWLDELTLVPIGTKGNL